MDILLYHGGGGEETWNLINSIFIKYFSNPILNSLEDSASLELNAKNIAFTTDSFTVSPLFFNGGNIGKLAIAGTVNDLSVMGAKPLYLSSGFIIEEGFSLEELELIVQTMAIEANKVGVYIVTGDTKVVPKGAVDKLFINTSGIGEIIYPNLSISNLAEGQKIVVSGTLGDHGACIMALREGIKLDIDLVSDCECMWDLIYSVIKADINIYAMRDPTRGGLAAVLNEWARQSGVIIEVQEEQIPLKDSVIGLSELLGLDPLQFASEGKIIFAVHNKDTSKLLEVLHKHPLGKDAQIIGEVVQKSSKGQVILKNLYGSRRILEPPVGELLPRIC